METLTKPISGTSTPSTSLATPNATSSPESVDGRSLCAAPAGLTIGMFGQDRALASLSPRQAQEAGLLTSGTYGRSFTSLYGFADLTSSLASRLKLRLPTDGLTSFAMTWREKDTPAGRSLPRLAASGRRTSGNAYGGWPTTCGQDGPNGGPAQGTDRLPGAADLTGWPTPTARDHKDGSSEGTVPTNGLLGRQVWEVSGLTLNGSPAETEKPGQLNPAFSLWLMGYPPEWESCAPLATPSSRKSRKISSERTVSRDDRSRD